VVLATSPTLVTPALGTPSAINLTNATGLGYSALPVGSVLQVVQSTYSTAFSTTSGTPVSTGFLASITPKFTTSKILVTIFSTLGVPANMNGHAIIYRDSTQLTTTTTPSYATYGAAQYQNSAFTVQYLDSPATTSSTTYTLYAYRNGVSATFYVGAREDGGSVILSTVTLMEIAG
jgi:hypothetical protein